MDNNEPIPYHGYLTLVELAHKNHPDWRLGQAYFNVLYQVREDLANQVRSTNLDPFYTHTYNRLHKFLTFVQENW